MVNSLHLLGVQFALLVHSFLYMFFICFLYALCFICRICKKKFYMEFKIISQNFLLMLVSFLCLSSVWQLDTVYRYYTKHVKVKVINCLPACLFMSCWSCTINCQVLKMILFAKSKNYISSQCACISNIIINYIFISFLPLIQDIC